MSIGTNGMQVKQRKIFLGPGANQGLSLLFPFPTVP
jgi:hypothetical protein